MARRLLGAESATVFNIQEPEEEAANQVGCSPGLLRQIPVLLSPLPILLRTLVLGSILWKAEGRSKKSSINVIDQPHS